MIRNIKALGLAFLAIGAIGALTASAAQAQGLLPVHITTQLNKAVVTAQNSAGTQHTLTIGATTIHCQTAKLEGTVSQEKPGTQLTATEIHATPTYSGCTGFGGIPVTVQMHGCTYTIVATANQLTANGGVTGCTPNKQITIKSSACTVFIGNQTGDLPHITFTNNAETGTEKHHIQDHVTVTGIKYTTNGQFFCPQAATAEYKGTTTIKAFEDAGTKVVTLHEHQYTEHLCGKEVGILAT